MPLIRYAVGDRGRIAVESTVCRCGRMLPAVSSIEGRTNDLLITRNGRRVYWLNPIFYGLPVREAQIIQKALDQVWVRYVPASNFTPEAGRSIIKRLRERMGAVEVILEQMDKIPREDNGKFRPMVCNLSQAEWEYLRQAGR